MVPDQIVLNGIKTIFVKIHYNNDIGAMYMYQLYHRNPQVYQQQWNDYVYINKLRKKLCTTSVIVQPLLSVPYVNYHMI